MIKVSSAIQWTAFTTGVRTLLQFLQLAILARILDPTDYGHVAMVAVVFAIGNILVNFGVGASLIHRKDLKNLDISSSFWLSVGIGLLFLVLFSASAPWLSLYMGEPTVEQVVTLFGIALFASSLGFVHDALLLKHMRHKTRGLILLGSQVVIFVSSITLAMQGFGAASLIIPNIVASLLAAVLAILLSPQDERPALAFSVSACRKNLQFGFFQTATSLCNELSANIDTFVLGKIYGPAALGPYFVAKNLALQPQQMLSQVLLNVWTPVMAKADDEDRLAQALLKSVRGVASVNLPAYSILAILAPEIVWLVFGPKWTDSVIYLQLFCIYFAIRSMTSPIGSLATARGKPRYIFFFTLGFAVFMLPAVLFAAQLGMTAAIAAIAGVMGAFLFLQHALVVRHLLPSLSPGAYFSAYLTPLLTCAGYTAVCMLVTTIDASRTLIFGATIIYLVIVGIDLKSNQTLVVDDV